MHRRFPPPTLATIRVDYDDRYHSATGTPVTLSHTATPVVTGSAGVGDNTATWNPTVAVSVPTGAVGGNYTGTLTQSVA